MAYLAPTARAFSELAAMSFAEIEEYWRSPARLDAEIAANRASVHAAIDAGMEPINERQRKRWADEENGNV